MFPVSTKGGTFCVSCHTKPLVQLFCSISKSTLRKREGSNYLIIVQKFQLFLVKLDIPPTIESVR